MPLGNVVSGKVLKPSERNVKKIHHKFNQLAEKCLSSIEFISMVTVAFSVLVYSFKF